MAVKVQIRGCYACFLTWEKVGVEITQPLKQCFHCKSKCVAVLRDEVQLTSEDFREYQIGRDTYDSRPVPSEWSDDRWNYMLD